MASLNHYVTPQLSSDTPGDSQSDSSSETPKCYPKGSIHQKIAEFYEIFWQTWGGDQPDFISVIQNYICTQNTVKILNKDFIKAVRGGGDTVLRNFFIKFRFFSGDGFP